MSNVRLSKKGEKYIRRMVKDDVVLKEGDDDREKRILSVYQRYDDSKSKTVRIPGKINFY